MESGVGFWVWRWRAGSGRKLKCMRRSSTVAYYYRLKEEGCQQVDFGPILESYHAGHNASITNSHFGPIKTLNQTALTCT